MGRQAHRSSSISRLTSVGRTIEQRGIAINNAKLEPGVSLSETDLLHGRYLLVRRGKANYHLVDVG